MPATKRALRAEIREFRGSGADAAGHLGDQLTSFSMCRGGIVYDDMQGARPSLSGMQNQIPSQQSVGIDAQGMGMLREALAQQERELERARAIASAKVRRISLFLSIWTGAC